MNPKAKQQVKVVETRRRRAKVPRSVFTMAYASARKVRLVYAASFNFSESAAGVGAFRYYRLNSAYDVDTTLGSTTTAGFAEWSAFYSNYRVWSAAVHLEAAVSGGSAGSVATVCFVPNSLQATLPTNPEVWPVQPQAVHRTILMYSSGGANKVTHTRRYAIPTICRVTQAQFMNDFDFTATTASNPARQAYLAVTVHGTNSSTAVTLFGQFYLSMEIEFFNPIQLSS